MHATVYIILDLLVLSQVVETRNVNDYTVSDFVRAGGQYYKIFTDNCIHGANRMNNLGHQ